METDHLGLPYLTNYGPPFPHSGAADLGTYAPPATLEPSTSRVTKVMAMEHGTATAHFGSPLSHHAQQATALAYLRQHAGFDSVVRLRVEYDHTDPVDLYLETTTGFWTEIPCA